MTPLESEILRAVGSQPWIRLFRRHVGMAVVRGQTVRFGIAGQADLYGWLVPSGRHVEIECKSGKGRLSAAQIKWRAQCEATGVVYVLARSVEQTLMELQQWATHKN